MSDKAFSGMGDSAFGQWFSVKVSIIVLKNVSLNRSTAYILTS